MAAQVGEDRVTEGPRFILRRERAGLSAENPHREPCSQFLDSRRMPKRRCPVCRSREWHKEPSSGLIICSEGHVLQNYRNETTETTELGPHALRKRTIKSGRVKKEQQTKADGRLYHGPRARYHYFECLQLLLRKQIAALIEAWKLPTEFEIVCRDVWALHLSLLPHPPPPEPYFYAQGQASEPTSDRRGPKATDSDEEDDIGNKQKSSSSSSASDSENDDTKDVTGHDTLLADLLHEASQSESSEDDDVNAATSKGVTAPPKKSRNRYEVPAANVAVLMLACWTMRLPVMYMDLIRLIESYTLPYLDPVRLLPLEMKRHLARETVLALSPRFPPRPLALHALTSRLARLCWSSYGIHTPEMNVAPMLWRTVRAMSGTSTLYALTKSIADMLSLPLTLHPSLSPALVQSKRKEPRQHKSDNVPPELALAAAVTVVLKLVYGLDGTERRPVMATDPACALPRLDDYLTALRTRGKTAHEDLFSALSHASVLDQDGGQLDLYLDFCERALLGNEETDDKVVAEFFPLNSEGGQACDGAAAAPETPLRAVVPGKGAMEPGSGVRIYNTLDILGTVPGAYGTVLEAGARLTGVDADDVAGVVERFERRLVRRAEIVRSRS